jgi:MFS transporter, DHA1 family, tetracycline resistance protein
VTLSPIVPRRRRFGYGRTRAVFNPHVPTTARCRLPPAIHLLVGVSFVVALGYGIVVPALPIFARSFDVGVTAASALASAFAATRLAFAPVTGRLVGRVSEVRLFCSGMVIVAASSGACAVATTYGQLLLFRAAGGVGSTMFTISAALLLIRTAPSSLRGRATGAWATGFLLGTVAGPLIGGVLIAVSLRAPFVAYVGLLVLAAAVSAAVLGRRAADRPDDDQPAAPSVSFVPALRHAAFRAALTSNVAHGWIVYGVRVALVPLYVVDVLARPAAWSGLALAVTAAGTALTLLISGRWSDSRGRKRPIQVGLAVTVAGTLWLGLATSVPEFLAASLLAGLGTGLVNPPTNAAVADVVAGEGCTVRSGSALAGFQMVGDVGAVVGPVLAGSVAEAAGYGAAFAFSAAIAAVSFGFWSCAPETLPRLSAASDVDAGGSRSR